MPSAATRVDRPRYEILDGIRGVAILLVVLSHSWTLVPLGSLRQYAPIDGLFHAGNQGVTIFFVVGGFLVTRTLLRRAGTDDGLRPVRYFVERMIRIGVHLYPLLLVIVLVHLADRSDPYTDAATYKSVATITTYTWNWYLENSLYSPHSARADLGHLWYLSVQEQFYLGLIVILALFVRFRRRLLVGVVIAIALVTLWRIHTWHYEGAWRTPLRTTTRCDGLLWGVLAALVVERLTPLRRFAGPAFTGSLAVIAAVILSSARFRDGSYYTWHGVVLDAACAVWVVAAYHLNDTTPTGLARRARRVLNGKPLVAVGAASLSIYLWHYPLFWFIARHTFGWNWLARTLLAGTVLAGLVVPLHRYVDEPSRRWLYRFGRRPRRTAGSEVPAVPAVEALEHAVDPDVRQS